ncbi:MAG: hypothetical protein RIC16_15735 [Rhodospirillales bacterium]
MAKNARAKADKHFSASQKKEERLLAERAKAREDRIAKTERLRALRLAREAAAAESKGD